MTKIMIVNTTFAKFQVDTLAAALVNVGLEKGDHVAIWGFNSVEWYLSFLAVVRGGFVAVS